MLNVFKSKLINKLKSRLLNNFLETINLPLITKLVEKKKLFATSVQLYHKFKIKITNINNSNYEKNFRLYSEYLFILISSCLSLY